MKLKSSQGFVIVVLLIAAWFRTYRLDAVPPGPHHDAVINGQIVDEFIWPVLPAWLRPAESSSIPWLTLQANPNGPDLQEHAWLYQVALAGTLGTMGRNVIGMRFADLIWGMLTVSACYALARRLFGRNVALIATAAQAVSFWSVSIGRAGLRTGVITPLLALAGCAFWDAWQGPPSRGSFNLRKVVFSGGLFGLSVYGYLSARPMVLVFVAFAAYLGLTRRAEWKKLLPELALFLVTAAIVVAPLWLYLRGHPEENLRFNMLSGPLQDLLAGRPSTILQSTVATLGMFFWRGDPQWQYNVAGRPVFDPAGAVLFIIGVGLAAWRWRRPANAFALMWLAVSLSPSMLSLPAPHLLRAVAGQAITFALAGIGASELLRLARRVARARLDTLVYVGLAVWWLAFAAWNYQGYFVAWANNDEVRFYYQGAITEAARYLDRRADTTPVAACSVFLNEHEDFIRSPRETFPFILRRTDVPIRWFDCRDSLVIPAGGRARLMFPGLAPYSSTLDSALLPWMSASTPIHDDLVPDGTLYSLDATHLLAAEIVSLTQTSEVSWSPESGVTGLAQLPTDFDHTLQFLGYRVERARRQAGKDVRVMTYWRVLKSPPLFLTGFMHLLTDPTHILAQHDRQALLYDTLLPGDVFMQLYNITIPDGAPPGGYRLSVGWYVGLTGQRLTVYDGATPRGNRLMLQEITVRP
jgi:4-amino-4-deoxy-L-arabinose transferase-like glycosyltransferase